MPEKLNSAHQQPNVDDDGDDVLFDFQIVTCNDADEVAPPVKDQAHQQKVYDDVAKPEKLDAISDTRAAEVVRALRHVHGLAVTPTAKGGVFAPLRTAKTMVEKVQASGVKALLSRMLCSKHEFELADVLQLVSKVPQVFLVALVLLLDWAISVVVSLFGLGVAALYSMLDWENHFRFNYLIYLTGTIFTTWNIAQYASFAIQTTGHQLPRDHVKAILCVGGDLLLCNMIGWVVCIVCVNFGEELAIEGAALFVICPSIGLGIMGKMRCKLNYFRRHFDKLEKQKLEGKAANEDDECKKGCLSGPDALGTRLMDQVDVAGSQCPFHQVVGCKALLTNCAGPYTCFFWTLMYAVGMRLMFRFASSLEDGSPDTVDVLPLILKSFTFALAMVFFLFGQYLLERWIDKSHGYMGYSAKMNMAFYFIYGLISDLQIRLCVVQFDGAARVVCALIHPAIMSVLRCQALNRIKLGFHDLVTTSARWLSEEAGSKDETAAEKELIKCEYARANATTSSHLLALVSSLITQNISAFIVTGVTCIFENSQLHLGSCPKGVWVQIAQDSFPMWLGDISTVGYLTGLGVPLVYYFFLLDHFVVVAVLVVAALSVALVLFTAGIGSSIF
eukprot:TRINITY_DN14162_c0_g3_i1.p1 TRINITY_DN14162_c0_g3~~TRINITY_DN14162_c0_g3_i1.p1  ORF type:complete len:617 (+),score=106.29 TRINITY_DN14162_c0_g3_i1:111-1961(+)